MDHSVRSAVATPPPGEGYERRDAPVRGILIFAACLAATVAGVLFLIYVVQGAITGPRRASPPPPAPAVLSKETANLRRREAETLAGYGWVDRKAGVVRIPIDRAIELAARKGVPHGKGPRTEAEINSHHGTRP